MPPAELAEGAALELPHPFPGQAQPTADLRERQALTLHAEAEHQDLALAPVELPDEPRRDGPLILGIHTLLGPALLVLHHAGQSTTQPAADAALDRKSVV